MRQWDNTVIDKIKTTYFPINSSISTTGHKLQGKTLNNLVVNSWGYCCAHWVYVVLSRVQQLDNLVLNVKLDPNWDYSARDELVRWERYIKDNIERKWLENRMVNGSLQREYEKPYKFKTFTINIISPTAPILFHYDIKW